MPASSPIISMFHEFKRHHRLKIGGGEKGAIISATAYSPNSWDKYKVISRVLVLLRFIPFIDPSKVTATADFQNDLQLDTLDNVEVILAIEQEFPVDILDNDAEKMQPQFFLLTL